jgi:hypothetical protein
LRCLSANNQTVGYAPRTFSWFDSM